MESTKMRKALLKKCLDVEFSLKYLDKLTDIMIDKSWEEKEEIAEHLYNLIKDCKSKDEMTQTFVREKMLQEEDL